MVDWRRYAETAADPPPASAAPAPANQPPAGHLSDPERTGGSPAHLDVLLALVCVCGHNPYAPNGHMMTHTGYCHIKTGPLECKCLQFRQLRIQEEPKTDAVTSSTPNP